MKKILLMSISLLFLSIDAFCASNTISDSTGAKPKPTGYLGGRMMDDVTGNPIKGGKVTFKGLKKTGKTDGTGYYMVEVPIGTYTVVFSCPGCKDLTQVGVTIRESGTTTQDVMMLRDPNSSLEPPIATPTFNTSSTGGSLGSTGWISGRVRDASTLIPITGALIKLRGMNRETTSDMTGLYKLGGVSEGLYSLEISCEGYEDKTFDNVHVRSSRPTSQAANLVPLSSSSGEKKTGEKRNFILYKSTGSGQHSTKGSSDMTDEERRIAEIRRQQQIDSVKEEEKTNGAISGKVVYSDTHRATEACYVGLEELKLGTKTDEDGFFTFSVPPGSYTLDFGLADGFDNKRITGVKVRTQETTNLTVELSKQK